MSVCLFKSITAIFFSCWLMSLQAQISKTKEIDTRLSVIKWKGTKFNGLGKHEGIVKISSGKVMLKNNRLEGGKFTIAMNTIQVTDIPLTDPVPRQRLRKHLSGPDFFDVKNYPEAVFIISNINYLKSDRYRITGNLTLHGHAKPVSFYATCKTTDKGHFNATAKVIINRQNWRISYRGVNAAGELVVDDEVELVIHLVSK